MRYNAFFGELPINAFKPRVSGGMTLEGGGNPISSVTDAISDIGSSVDDAISQNWVDLRDTAEAAAVVAGNYVLPGSSLVTSKLVTGGAQDRLDTDLGRVANLAAGVTGGVDGNLANYGRVGEAVGLTGSSAPTVATDGTALSGIDLGGVGASPNTWLGGGEYGLVPAAVAGTTAAQLAGAGAAGAGASAAGAGAAGAAGGSALSNALIAGTVGSTIAGIAGANAATDAANTQAAAADRAAIQQQANFDLINRQQAPYRAAGYGALGDIGSLGTGTYQMYDAQGNPTTTGTGSGYLQHQFDATDLAKGLAPNYDFMLQQGQMANQRAANVGGGALSGNTLQGLNKYTQDYAGNAYQNAFTNYQTQRNNIYNTLAGIAGIGQTGQTATNTAATNATNAATQLGVGSAAAQAAGTIGSTNAYTGAINNAMNNYTLASLLQQGGRVG